RTKDGCRRGPGWVAFVGQDAKPCWVARGRARAWAMLRLTHAEVERFARDSGDHNPLHLSPAYARATAFGQPIAHGVLGLLEAMRALPRRPGTRLAKIAVEFPRPLLPDHDYPVAVADGGAAIEVRDGSRPV